MRVKLDHLFIGAEGRLPANFNEKSPKSSRPIDEISVGRQKLQMINILVSSYFNQKYDNEAT